MCELERANRLPAVIFAATFGVIHISADAQRGGEGLSQSVIMVSEGGRGGLTQVSDDNLGI